MKRILTWGLALSFLLTCSAITEAQGENTDLNAKNLKTCEQQLVAIGEAIRAYQTEHDALPTWLSELHPRYLRDKTGLLCPADKRGGKAIFGYNVDPNLPVSYGYQFHPEYRDGKTEERRVYGDAIPMVRCRHHVNPNFECLNLSFDFQISKSAGVWQRDPVPIYGSLDAAITAYEGALQRMTKHERFAMLRPELIRLYMKVGRKDDADNFIDRFKSDMNAHLLEPEQVFVLGDMLEAMHRYEEVLGVLTQLEAQQPQNPAVLRKLSQIHRKLGDLDLAAEYMNKARPGSALIGKPVPDFSATDLEGNPISLKAYRGKVVLLDFWAVWCQPCIAEMPNLKKVYDTYKDAGFDIIGISLDNDETQLRDYLKANNIPWRQVFSGQGWMSPIARQYGIRAIPAPWLIDREGKLISHQARGESLERLVAEAVKDESTD